MLILLKAFSLQLVIMSHTVDDVSHVGRVKWFNSKAGYGFLTVTDGEKANMDVFVHHSQVQVGKEQYRYLVQGEYVQFEWCDTETSDHRFQAGNVKGMNGGKLMCETRNENRPRTHAEQNSNSRYRGDVAVAHEGQEELTRVNRRKAPPKRDRQYSHDETSK